MPDHHIAFGSDLTDLEYARQRLRRMLAAYGSDEQTIDNAELVVEEIGTNIIHYGYAGQPGHTVDLLVHIGESDLCLTFADDAKPFNPLTEIELPDLASDDDERATGGFGFYLVRMLSDNVSYDRRDGKNVLSVRLSGENGCGAEASA